MRKRCERDRTQKAKFELSISAQRETSKSPFVSNPAYHDAMRDLRCSTSRIFKCDERRKVFSSSVFLNAYQSDISMRLSTCDQGKSFFDSVSGIQS